MLHSSTLDVSLMLLRWATVGMVVAGGAIAARPADAQLIPDGTLGAEQSQILNVGGGRFDIGGGVQRDINLFHSFQEFNVENFSEVFFINPAGVENILTRVTGDNPSNILGVLGVVGDANLFLMNPNGIVFGLNAQLNLQGSFVATTADGIGFGGQEVFSALTPEVPSPLLTVNPEAFFFNQLNPGAITNNSVAFAGVDPSGALLVGLRVVDGQDLLFLGGDIRFNIGNMIALGGRVQLAAVNDIGQVRLTDEGRLRLPRRLQRGDIEFANGALIDVTTADNGGEINISARTITLTDGSILLAGIIPGQSSPDSRAGNIALNASAQVLLQERSAIRNVVFADATGTAGNIEIRTDTLEVRDGARLSSSAFGTGNAGNVVIRAGDRVTFAGISEDGQVSSAILSTLETGGIGDGGNIVIRTATLEVLDGAQLAASTRGEGNAGNVVIRAGDHVIFSGTTEDGQLSSGAGSTVEAGGIGDGGNVVIRTDTLEVRDGAQLQALTRGEGNAGNVVIRAGDRVTFAGTSEDGQLISAAFSSVDLGGIGAGGNIEIRTTNLEMLDGAQLVVSTFGEGNAGNVVIHTNTLDVLDGAVLQAVTSGEGNAGNVVIRAGDRVTFAGTSEDGQSRSTAGSAVAAGGRGGGGDINIRTNTLEVLNGALLSAGTDGEGNAGNIIIWAGDRVTFAGTSEDGQFPSAAGSLVGLRGRGDGGNIEIRTDTLEVRDGAGLSSSTLGTGNAGNVIIEAGNRIDLDGVSANGVSRGIFTFAAITATGRGGAVIITVPELRISDGVVINARTENARRGGNITLDLDRLTLTEGGQVITTSTLIAGRAGNISVQADRVQISGSAPTLGISNEGNGASGLFTNTRSGSGDGGNITLRLNDLEMTDGAILSAQSQGTGTAGRLTIRARGNVILTDSNLTTSAEQSSGGAIFVSARDIRLFGDSDITTFVQSGEGGGGDITLRGDTIVAFSDSDILAFSVDGSGGNITLDTRAFFGENYRPATGILTREQLEALDGNNRVDINATGQVQSGDIVTPDTSFIQNSLSNLSETVIDTESLLANSCIARTTQGNTFLITGGGGLPERPGDLPIATYSTGDVRSIPDGQESTDEAQWQFGDPIMEPQGVYQLPDGRLVLSRECD